MAAQKLADRVFAAMMEDNKIRANLQKEGADVASERAKVCMQICVVLPRAQDTNAAIASAAE